MGVLTHFLQHGGGRFPLMCDHDGDGGRPDGSISIGTFSSSPLSDFLISRTKINAIPMYQHDMPFGSGEGKRIRMLRCTKSSASSGTSFLKTSFGEGEQEAHQAEDDASSGTAAPDNGAPGNTGETTEGDDSGVAEGEGAGGAGAPPSTDNQEAGAANDGHESTSGKDVDGGAASSHEDGANASDENEHQHGGNKDHDQDEHRGSSVDANEHHDHEDEEHDNNYGEEHEAYHNHHDDDQDHHHDHQHEHDHHGGTIQDVKGGHVISRATGAKEALGTLEGEADEAESFVLEHINAVLEAINFSGFVLAVGGGSYFLYSFFRWKNLRDRIRLYQAVTLARQGDQTIAARDQHLSEAVDRMLPHETAANKIRKAYVYDEEEL
ncbi:unnamed protein product [Amoebophrya sp. A120]|nr:unnamed protein product [Amoebophrya sp. A120]|eukprot:GSA120T00001405001.1